MEREPLLSVIVPVYNVETYLSRCVDSILGQTYQNMEIILIDDGSRDSSGEICDAYAQKDSRIRVIHKENGGLSSARNVGLEAAGGVYIAFVDSDDWIEPDAYRHLMELATRLDVKLVCGGRYDVDGRTGDRKVGLCPKKEEVITGEELAGRIFTWDQCDSSACDKLYHRSLLEGFRYPEGKICEDVPVIYRIALKAEAAAMSDRPFYNYFHRPGSITMTAVSEKNFHFPEHTAVIYPYIRENHPAIADQARFQRVKSLLHVLLLLDTTQPEVRRNFRNQYASFRNQLRPHVSFVLKNHRFGKKEKLTCLLLVLGLYRWLRPMFTRRKLE